MAKFKYLGMAIINKNYIHREIKSRLNQEFLSVQNILPSVFYLKTLRLICIKLLIFSCCSIWVWNLVFHFKRRKFHNLYTSLNIPLTKSRRRRKQTRHVACMGHGKCIQNLCWKPKGFIWKGWEDIKQCLKQIGWGCVLDMDQMEALMNMSMNL